MKNNYNTTNELKIFKISPCRFRKGQIILEAVWLALFAFAFLTMLAFLYEKGKKEIELSRNPHIKKPVNIKQFLLKQEG